MPANARKAKRHAVTQDGMIYTRRGETIARCRMRNVSATGAQVELEREAILPQQFLLSLSLNGAVRRRCTLMWQFSTVVGVKFEA